ncbi:hypothetical protein WUBG_03884, partial [Wuchereria bancrofti]
TKPGCSQRRSENNSLQSSTLSRVQPSIVESHRSVASLLNQPPILPIAVAAIRSTFAQNCQSALLYRAATPMLRHIPLHDTEVSNEIVGPVDEEPLDLSVKR